MASTTPTRPWIRVAPLALCALAFGASACTPSTPKADSAAPTTVEVVAVTPPAPVVEAPPEPVAPVVTEPPVTAPPVTAPPVDAPPVTAPPVTAPPAPVTTQPALMPSVVCMNLQDAQDLIQTAGVFLSLSHDATGQGRRQVNDSNWVVVAQNIPPGTPFGEGEADLAVVKDGEPGTC